MYNLEVGRELLKQIYVSERLAPPSSVAQVTGVYQNLWSRISNPTYWREVIRTGEYKQIGVYAVEAYGIFKVSSSSFFFALCFVNGMVLLIYPSLYL